MSSSARALIVHQPMSLAGLEIQLAIRGLESVIDTDWVRPGPAPAEIGADVRLPVVGAEAGAAWLRRPDFRSIAAPAAFTTSRRTAHPTAQQLDHARRWGDELGQELRPFIGPVHRRITTTHAGP